MLCIKLAWMLRNLEKFVRMLTIVLPPIPLIMQEIMRCSILLHRVIPTFSLIIIYAFSRKIATNHPNCSIFDLGSNLQAPSGSEGWSSEICGCTVTCQWWPHGCTVTCCDITGRNVIHAILKLDIPVMAAWDAGYLFYTKIVFISSSLCLKSVYFCSLISGHCP